MSVRSRRVLSILMAVMLMFGGIILVAPVKANAAYSVNNYLAKWEGEYAGSTGSSTVMRHFILVLTDFTDNQDGTYEVKGTCSFSASHDTAEAARSSLKGSYYIKGTAEPSTGKITSLQGYDWIDDPGNFSFVTFNGAFKNSTRIEGSTDNGSFYCDRISGISNDLSVIMTLKGKTTTTNLLNKTATFKKNATDICTIVACYPVAWGGNHYGEADLVQGTKVIKTSKTGAFVDLVPGQELEVGTPVKVVFKDASGNAKKTVTLKLSVVNNSKTLTKPGKTKIYGFSVNCGSKHTVRVYWNKKKCDGYQVQMASSKKFTKKSIIATGTYYGKDNNVVRVDKVSSDVPVYFRVRCFNKNDKKTKYGAWSAVRGITVH